jgi:glycerol-3-phosphate dehydrogenase
MTITGGKWTTYRQMAEDCVNRAAQQGKLAPKECRTHSLHIHGYLKDVHHSEPLSVYGGDATLVRHIAANDPSLGERLHSALPNIGAEVIWAARHEMARSAEDILARRTRMLFLDASAAMEAAPLVARLLAKELGRDDAWQAQQLNGFKEVAARYLISRTNF